VKKTRFAMPMKLLIADDELSTRVFLRHCAAKWGYELAEASDGLEALSMLREADPPRIAVLDWMMPGLDGVEICSRLSAQNNSPLIYTILLTGRNDKDDVIHALDNGAHDFLSKPVHIGELQSRIAVGRRLVEAHDRLLELDRLKERFLRLAAHDLRNPLGYIITMSEMLTDRDFVEVRQEMDNHLRSIHDTASTMQSLINDLLDLAAVWEGRFTISKKSASLTEILRTTVAERQNAAAERQLRLVEQLAEMPPVSCDPDRIQQSVDRLLTNAFKLAPSASTVTVSAELKKDSVRVAVADQGPRRNSRELAAFSTAAAPSADGQDSSLSLTVVKKIIELHQGQVLAEKQADGGSVFSFTLPLT
jgi:two-component system sensor histidine kinase/response regulator